MFADGTIYFAAWDLGGVGADFDYYQRLYDKNQDNKITSAEFNFRWDYPKFDRDKDGFVTREEFDSLKKFMGQSRNGLLAIRPGGKGDVHPDARKMAIDVIASACPIGACLPRADLHSQERRYCHVLRRSDRRGALSSAHTGTGKLLCVTDSDGWQGVFRVSEGCRRGG